MTPELATCTHCKKVITLEDDGINFRGEPYHDQCLTEATKTEDSSGWITYRSPH